MNTPYEVLGTTCGFDIMSMLSSGLGGLFGGGGSKGPDPAAQQAVFQAQQQQYEMMKAKQSAARTQAIAMGVGGVVVLGIVGVLLFKTLGGSKPTA